MRILFDNSTDFDFDNNIKDMISKVIEETLKYENFSNDVEISFSIVDNREIKELNLKYRNIDKETDVLSFPLIDFQNGEKPNFKNTIILGDIVISIDKAISQANEYGHSINRELSFLTVHSMLHLLGYDHINDKEEKIMFKKQDDILNSLSILR